MSLKKLGFMLIGLAFAGLVQAADLAREQRIAAQIQDAILDGDPIQLNDGAHDFLGIYMRSSATPIKGAALILHGRGANPDWMDVVQPLRIGLTEYGWDTLSIQLPVAFEGASDQDWAALVPEAVPRIDAALAFLKQRNIDNVVIVAHSFGSRMAANYLAEKQPPQVRALVAIGMSADRSNPDDDNLAALRKIKLPLYDVYGERDLDAVRDSANARKLAAGDAGNVAYRQNRVPGANHFFTGQDQELLAIVRAWMQHYAKGVKAD